jgi:hybrid cluster-associated redox disulfide protein
MEMENQVKADVERMITADMPIGQVIGMYPDTISVFLQHGLGCVGCAIARFENIRAGAMAHGINLEALIEDLNRVAAQAPAD